MRKLCHRCRKREKERETRKRKIDKHREKKDEKRKSRLCRRWLCAKIYYSHDAANIVQIKLLTAMNIEKPRWGIKKFQRRRILVKQIERVRSRRLITQTRFTSLLLYGPSTKMYNHVFVDDLTCNHACGNTWKHASRNSLAIVMEWSRRRCTFHVTRESAPSTRRFGLKV